MGLIQDKESTEERKQPPADDGRPGRVEVDSRGRNVWRWARDVIDSTSVLLKRLENKDLALEPTRKVPVIRPGQPGRADAQGAAKGRGPSPKGGRQLGLADAPRDKGGGFDPYNSR